MAGSKFDEDFYKKVDLSLIPKKVLEINLNGDGCSFEPDSNVWFFLRIHLELDKAQNASVMVDSTTCRKLLEGAFYKFSCKELAVSLGYGERKYGRNNWREGFGGNPNRFLKACLRHYYWLLMGELYDGEALEGYPLGNSHEGAILFSLMVAWYEAQRLEEKEEGGEEEGIS